MNESEKFKIEAQKYLKEENFDLAYDNTLKSGRRTDDFLNDVVKCYGMDERMLRHALQSIGRYSKIFCQTDTEIDILLKRIKRQYAKRLHKIHQMQQKQNAR